MYAETMTRYSANGAQEYLAELRQSLARCSSVQRDGITVRYRQVSTGQLGGDESILATRTYPTSNGPQITFRIAAIRFGDVVLVVLDQGWEGTPSPTATWDGFLATSIERARSWR